MISSECRLSIAPPDRLFKPLEVPKKLLLTPGPSNLREQVRKAMSLPVLGELDTEYLEVMEDVKEGLHYVFQTKNEWTLAICGRGHAGLEACIVNILEKGEVIMVCTKGLWGQRAAEVGKRMGAVVKEISKPLGEWFSLEEIEQGLKEHHPVALFITHGESSSGICQPLEGMGQLCHKYECLFIVDAVASLGGVPFLMDKLEVDVVYAGAQKVLNCPTGASPLSFSPRAREKVENRKTKVQSFYFDMVELSNYWGCDEGPRRYHHTGQISNTYGLREGLAQLAQEGLENSWKRHQANAKLLWQGLQDMGLSFYIKDENLRLPTVTTVNIPYGLDWQDVTKYLREKHSVDIAGGIGPSRGKVWRIGLLGCNSTEENVQFILRILEEALDACRK